MKSDAKGYVVLAQHIYYDACAKCSAKVSDLRDLKTLRSRVKHEGMSFLTITLPKFASDFEQSLASGSISSDHFLEFKKVGAIPAFLQGMLSWVFDRETGRLRDDSPNLLEIVEGVRQFCAAFKKIRMPCSPAREAAAIERFINVEQDFSSLQIDAGSVQTFRSVSLVLWSRMLGRLLPDMLLPRHGPGATAERISGNQKYAWLRWHDRLEPFFPLLGYGYSHSAGLKWNNVRTTNGIPLLDCYSQDDRSLESVTIVAEDQEQPVRVIFVPKTLKSPRVIAIEPVCMQYTQQALQAWLYAAIAKNPLTAGHVNFRDQSVNRSLALAASSTGEWATIDLSDASDRVPHELALEMFSSNPDFRDAVDSCRSRRAELPNGVVLTLKKFASMGSALCFPIEAMYFHTLCVTSLLRKYKLSPTYRNVRNVSRFVYIYGDDIIVRKQDAEAVIGTLQEYNCKVNERKSFWTGKFRESCGLDAYDGRDVTITYLRELRPDNRQQVSQIVSWIATANLFAERGYDRTSSFMFAHVEDLLGTKLPLVEAQSPLLGRIDHYGLRPLRPVGSKFRRRFQRLEQRGWVVSPVSRSDKIGSYAALQKSLIGLEQRGKGLHPDLRFSEHGDSVAHAYMIRWLQSIGRIESSLEHSARRGAVTLKLRWVAVT
jgi:hypothetical protein